MRDKCKQLSFTSQAKATAERVEDHDLCNCKSSIACMNLHYLTMKFAWCRPTKHFLLQLSTLALPTCHTCPLTSEFSLSSLLQLVIAHALWAESLLWGTWFARSDSHHLNHELVPAHISNWLIKEDERSPFSRHGVRFLCLHPYRAVFDNRRNDKEVQQVECLQLASATTVTALMLGA